MRLDFQRDRAAAGHRAELSDYDCLGVSFRADNSAEHWENFVRGACNRRIYDAFERSKIHFDNSRRFFILCQKRKTREQGFYSDWTLDFRAVRRLRSFDLRRQLHFYGSRSRTFVRRNLFLSKGPAQNVYVALVFIFIKRKYIEENERIFDFDFFQNFLEEMKF